MKMTNKIIKDTPVAESPNFELSSELKQIAKAH